MKRTISRAAVLIIPLVLAGCSALPSTNQAVAPEPTAHRATIVAQQVPTDPAASTNNVPVQNSPRSTSTDSVATTTATAGAINTPVFAASQPPAPSATSTVAPSATSTVAPSATSTAAPSETPTPTTIPTPVILAPIKLGEVEVGGSKLFPRYWTNTRAISFSMIAAPGTSAGLRPQVEVEPLAQPFKNVPTAEGALMSPNGAGTVVIEVSHLSEGGYHWQARLADDKGHAGPWTNYYQGPAFRLDRTPPEASIITSSTHPDQRKTYSAAMAQISWTKPYDNGGIQGYIVGVDRKPDGVPTGSLTAVNQTVLGPLRSGTLYVHVRAEDWAGNLGKIATYTLHIDHRVPELAHVFFDRFQFNPQFDQLSMHFVPDKTVQVTIKIRRQSTKGIVRIINLGQVPGNARAVVQWDGRNQRGVLVKADLYTLEIYAADTLGNVADAIYTDLGVNYRRIVVHLASQSIDVYDGDTLLRSTLATTGNQHLPTPLGVWHILSKYHPYKFISPWPKTSQFWYPTSAVNYALYFHSGGYFIHDAPWRSVFGPGTNSSPGLPGSGIYAGSHGCVETPMAFGQWLYTWAPIGTVVDVVQ